MASMASRTSDTLGTLNGDIADDTNDAEGDCGILAKGDDDIKMRTAAVEDVNSSMGFGGTVEGIEASEADAAAAAALRFEAAVATRAWTLAARGDRLCCPLRDSWGYWYLRPQQGLNCNEND